MSTFLDKTTSVDFRLGDTLGALEEIEVAAFVGLPRVLGEHLVIAARVVARRRLVSLDAVGNLGVAQRDVDRALFYIDRDHVAGAHGSERAANRRLRGDVQDAGPIARTAHAR